MRRLLVSMLLVFSLHCSHEKPADRNLGLANPASVHCGAVGGELRIETLASRGEIGICFFEDGRQCEEWALFRGACPVGGRRVTGLVTPGARYCVIRGGRYAMTQPETTTTPEMGRCTLPDGATCDTGAPEPGDCP